MSEQPAQPDTGDDQVERTDQAKPGCLRVVLGVVLVMIGIPMLLLPGPGLLSIIGGVSLIAAGLGLRRGEAR